MEDRFAEAMLVAAYKQLFLDHPMGSTVLADLASKGFFDRPTVAADPNLMYFNEGRRSLVLEIFAMLNIDVRKYLLENVTMEDI